MDASSLWGKGTFEVRDILKGQHGGSLRVVATGPAGDNMTSLATILADGDASGSGSLGAVMGSKKLKAIAVLGSGRVIAARPQQLQELLRRVADLRKDVPVSDRGGGEGIHIHHCFGCTSECNRGTYEAKDGTKGKFMCQRDTMLTCLSRSYNSNVWYVHIWHRTTNINLFRRRVHLFEKVWIIIICIIYFYEITMRCSH